MFVKKMNKTASLLLLTSVSFAAFGLASCSSNSTSTKPSDSSSMAQMDHGSMSSPNSTMPMDHASMMNMDLGPADKQFDLRFIDGMTPHHEGAVTMAQEALQKSNRPEIKQLAQTIINAQQQEISELKQWRTAWYPDASTQPVMYSAEMGHTMPMSEEVRSGMMMANDLGAADNQFDLRFINAMIPHHQGAINMAQQALEKSDRPEIKQLAQNIVNSQQQEIDQMMQWRRAWYGQ